MSLRIQYSLPVDLVYWDCGNSPGSAEDAGSMVEMFVSCWSNHFGKA